MNEAFEAALAADRYDRVTRLAYADWLEERGRDDEAAEMRRRATTEWEAADRWMHAFADRCGETCENYGEDWERDPATGEYRRTGVTLRWRPITYDDVIEAGRNYLRTMDGYAMTGRPGPLWADESDGVPFIQVGSETARDLFSGEEGELMRCLYWEHWQTVTGLTVHETRQGVPFSCSC